MVYNLRKEKSLFSLLFLTLLLWIFGKVELEEIKCGKPGNTPNCFYTPVEAAYDVGATVKYSCRYDGYYSIDAIERECLENSTWSGRIPIFYQPLAQEYIKFENRTISVRNSDQKAYCSCIRYTLKETKTINMIKLTYSHNLKGNDVRVKAKIVGSREVTCYRFSAHSNVDEKCIIFICNYQGHQIEIDWEAPPPRGYELRKVNMYIRNTTKCLQPDNPYMGHGAKLSISPDSEYSFTCNSDYQLVGEPKVYCKADGTWAPDSPQCKRLSTVTCDELPTVPNGKWITNSTSVGSTAWIQCNEGYGPVSNKQIDCMVTGRWNTQSVRCNIIKCDPNPNISHGKGKLLSGSSNYGSKLQIVCDSGYTATQSTLRECQQDSTWENLDICEENRCSSIPPVSLDVGIVNAGQWVFINSTFPMRVLICQMGYHIEGYPYAIRCLPNNSWSYTSAVCIRTSENNSFIAEWTPTTALLVAAAVGVGTAVSILCLAACCLALKKRQQSRNDESVFHVSTTDSIVYDERLKDQHFKASSYEEAIELKNHSYNPKPRKPSSSLPRLPLDTDPVYAQPFETASVRAKLTPSTATGDIYSGHIYAEPIDSNINPIGANMHNNVAENLFRSGAKTFGRKMSFPGRSSIPEDALQHTSQSNIAVCKPVYCSSNLSSNMLTEKYKTTHFESSRQDAFGELVSNALYLDTKRGGSGSDLKHLKMVDNDIYQDDFSNV